MDQSNKNDNLRIYNQIWKEATQDYKQFSAGNIWYNVRLSNLINKHLAPSRANIKSIADIGCGDGSRTWLISNLLRNAKITGYDFSESAILSATTHYQSERLTFVQGTAESFQGTFSMVCALEVLEHVDDWKRCICQMISSCPEYLLFSFPAGRMQKIDYLVGHLRNFKTGEVESFLASQGFRTIEANYSGFPFYNPFYIWIQGVLSVYYFKSSSNSMSKQLKFLHRLLSYSLLYFSTKKRYGKSFMGLFQRM